MSYQPLLAHFLSHQDHAKSSYNNFLVYQNIFDCIFYTALCQRKSSFCHHTKVYAKGLFVKTKCCRVFSRSQSHVFCKDSQHQRTTRHLVCFRRFLNQHSRPYCLHSFKNASRVAVSLSDLDPGVLPHIFIVI